jgi:FAD/FMN-containing dehydrogenase
VDPDAQTITVGGGVLLGELYTALASHDVITPLGECVRVGVAGLTLGGGFSLLSRSLGLACDNLLGATVVLASGDVLRCSESENTELLWALRGAGNGNFGVVTSLTLRAHPISPTVAYARVLWPLEQAVDVLSAALPMFTGSAPDGLNAVFELDASPGRAPMLIGVGVYNGPADEGAHLLAPFAALGTPAKVVAQAEKYATLIPHSFTQPARLDDHAHNYFKSGFVCGVVPADALKLLVAGVANAPTHDNVMGNAVNFELASGAVIRRAPADTAFIHRHEAVNVAILPCWSGAEFGMDPVEKQWADDLHAQLKGYLSGEMYQNYVDRELAGPLDAYYGDNLPRLRAIKRQYDPGNLFGFAQGISPA